VCMRLIQAWKHAITFFYPSNFKLFTLITVRSLLEAYKILLHNWWWLFAFIGGITLFKWSNAGSFFFLSVVLNYVFIFAFSLATRPSLKKKNASYFSSYLPLFLPTFTGFLSIKLFEVLLAKIIGIDVDQWQLVRLLVKSFSYATQVFFIFFFLDSNHTIRQLLQSLFRSVKMTVYNYPICLFFGLIILGLEITFSFFTGIFLFVWQEVAIFLRIIDLVNKIVFVPVQLSIFANIYIKKLHEQFDYYF